MSRDLWVYGSAFVVLVGVVGETIADLTTWVKSERRKRILAKASALVLIVGLTGDVVSIRITQLATASLNARAAEANERAGKAIERAGKAEADLEDAKRDAAVARKDAEGFQLQIALANKRAAQAEAQASQAQLDLAKFKAPRALTDGQAKAIADRLKPFGAHTFEVITYWDSKEPTAISQRIAYILVRLAGWNLEQPKAFEALLGGITGVIVYVHPLADDKTRGAANALVAALTDEGIDARLKAEGTDNNPKTNKISLQIGTK